jgi:hypothetical protein
MNIKNDDSGMGIVYNDNLDDVEDPNKVSPNKNNNSFLN